MGEDFFLKGTAIGAACCRALWANWSPVHSAFLSAWLPFWFGQGFGRGHRRCRLRVRGGIRPDSHFPFFDEPTILASPARRRFSLLPRGVDVCEQTAGPAFECAGQQIAGGLFLHSVPDADESPDHPVFRSRVCQ